MRVKYETHAAVKAFIKSKNLSALEKAVEQESSCLKKVAEVHQAKHQASQEKKAEEIAEKAKDFEQALSLA